jgi:cytochrome c553
MGFKTRFLPVYVFITLITFFFVAVFALNTVSAENVANSCVACHGKPGFRITDKKLYNYFLDWELSLHAREGVTCVDCHKGNPNRMDKDGAHGKDVTQLLTPVEYERISATCGKCHKENSENYKETRHYRVLQEGGRLHPTPTCINCHGSINTSVPKPETLTNICAHCHNAFTENHPEIPALASYLVERLTFLNSYYDHLRSKGLLEKSPDFSKAVDVELKGLSKLWHTLDLDRIEEKTLNIRAMMLKKGKELRKAE